MSAPPKQGLNRDEALRLALAYSKDGSSATPRQGQERDAEPENSAPPKAPAAKRVAKPYPSESRTPSASIEASPPHSEDAERAVLGACLIDPSAFPVVREVLDGENDFYFAEHRAVWRAIERVIHDDQSPDVVTVATVLREGGEFGGNEALPLVQSIERSAPNAKNAATYARLVKEKSEIRRIAANAEHLRREALSPGAKLDDLRQSATRFLEGVPEGKPIEALDLVDLASRNPAPPRTILPGLPIGYATLIAAHGGVGKSTIALTQAVCLASGRDFFGLEPSRPFKALFLSCEDREPVLHWRLARICAYLGVNMADIAGSLHVADLVGRDAVLWRAEMRGGGGGVTSTYGQVESMMRRTGAEVLYVDGIADTFSGNENDRGQVKQFVNAMLALVPSEQGALILIGHVPKSTTKGLDAEGYAGSTAWHNAVRARWYLHRERATGEDGASEAGASPLILESQKFQFGGGGDASMRFTWDDSAGLFVGELIAAPSRFDRAHQEREESRGILRSLRASIAAGVRVPTATTGRRTAFHVLLARPEFPATFKPGNKAQRDRFWQRVEVLRQKRAISEASYQRDNRHKATEFVLTSEGERQCVE